VNFQELLEQELFTGRMPNQQHRSKQGYTIVYNEPRCKQKFIKHLAYLIFLLFLEKAYLYNEVQ